MIYLKNIFWAFVYITLIFYLPRFLIGSLGSGNPWTSFFYMYGLGAIVFLIGTHIVIKTKACNFKLKSDRVWFRAMILGFFYFMSMHAIWIYYSLHSPTAI